MYDNSKPVAVAVLLSKCLLDDLELWLMGSRVKFDGIKSIKVQRKLIGELSTEKYFQLLYLAVDIQEQLIHAYELMFVLM